MIRWAVDNAPTFGARIVQLTSDAARVDAHRFYERLGVARRVQVRRAGDALIHGSSPSHQTVTASCSHQVKRRYVHDIMAFEVRVVRAQRSAQSVRVGEVFLAGVVVSQVIKAA